MSAQQCDCHDHMHIPDAESDSRICRVPVTDHTDCGCLFPPGEFGSTPRAAAYHYRRAVEALEATTGRETFAGSMFRLNDAVRDLGDVFQEAGTEWLRLLKTAGPLWRRLRRGGHRPARDGERCECGHLTMRHDGKQCRDCDFDAIRAEASDDDDVRRD